jgi:L-ascorbate metabolism protein UlaG (beta-lactamase superfamily)
MGKTLKRIGMAAAAMVAAAGLYGISMARHPDGPAAADFLPAGTLAPGKLTAQFFGTTTLLFRDGDHAVMVDGFLSRPGMWTVLTGKVATDRARVDAALVQGRVGKIDLIVTGHSHYDHALDAPYIAARTGALLAGSPSTLQIGRGGGLPEARLRALAGGERLSAGGFAVAVLKSLHSAGDRVPGTIDAPLAQPASVKEYREGGSVSYLIGHGGACMLVHPSANFVPGMYRGARADMVFLATGGLGAQDDAFAERYWQEVVRQTGARLVVPIHWDDFLRPLDKPMLPMRRLMDDFASASAKIARLAMRDGVAVRYMPVIDPVDLAAATPIGAAGPCLK